MKRPVILIIPVLFVAVLAGRSVSATVAARVNGEIIDQEGVDQLNKDVLKLPKGKEKEAVRKAITNCLLSQKAKKEFPDLVDEVTRTVDLTLARDYVGPYTRDFVAPRAEKAVTDEMVGERTPQQPDMIHLHQIVFADKKTAATVLPKLQKKELPFADAAKKYSKGLTAPGGGDIGGIMRNSTMYPEETLKLLFASPVGKVTDIIDTKLGPSVFLVSEKKSAEEFKKEMAKEVRKELLAAKTKDLLWLDAEQYSDKKGYKLFVTDKTVEGTPDLAMVALEFGGRKFTVEDVLSRSGGMTHGPKVILSIAESVFRDLAIQDLYVEAKGRLPGYDSKRRVLIDHYTARKLITRVNKDLGVDEAEVEAYMAAHPKDFDQPDRAELGVIYVKSEQRLKQVQKLLKEGKPFEEVAKGFSQDTKSAPKGGKLGLVPVQGLPKADFVAGQVSAPVKAKQGDSSGHYLFKTYSLLPAHRLTRQELDKETLGAIRSKILAEKREKALTVYMGDLYRTAKIEVP